MKGEIHVLQWGEEVFDVALLQHPDQNHIHLIQFILRHPQPFTSLISTKKNPAACQGLHIPDCNANQETQALIVRDGVFASAHQGWKNLQVTNKLTSVIRNTAVLSH